MKTKVFCLLLIFGILISNIPESTAYALEDNSELNESYVYTPYYDAVNCPAAYTLERVIGNSELGIPDQIAPSDVFASSDYIYVTCSKTNAVYILDKELNLSGTIQKIKGNLSGPDTLNTPEGIFVDGSENIYIADTQNKRILKVDREGNLIKELSDPQIKVLGEVVTFLPSKLVVDQANRIYVVGKNINRGIIELSQNGEFNTFIGAPKVKASFGDFIQRMFMTDEQIRRMEKFIPTEYNNVAIDNAGFLYGTIGSLDAEAVMTASYSSPDSTPDNAKPLLKLSPAGVDILFRRGNVPIIGELNFVSGDQSFINDVAIRPDGIYSILDQRHGRVFSYDMYGNLLHIFGSLGKQKGRFSSPSALCYFGEQLIVVDQISGKINVFGATEYGSMLLSAVKLDYDGKYDEAAALWRSLVKKNSNLFLAYTGIGKMYYREKDYDNAMVYFKSAYDYYYYDQSKEKLRKEAITQSIPAVFTLVIVIVVLWIVRKIVKKKRKGGNVLAES